MIEEFIDNFKRINRKELEESFLYGNCYWFACILQSRFPNALIYYDDIKNHFFCKIGRKFYDISGEIFPSHYILWTKYQAIEPDISKGIIENCIELRG